MATSRSPSFSITQKLIGLIAILMVFIVVVLATYFPSRHIAELTNGLVSRADLYGAVLSVQLAPAIAFGDRETAREVLSSLALDPDVSGAALFMADGKVLRAVGTMVGAPAPSAAATAERMKVDRDHIVVFAAVRTPEGPRGTLVVELSTARLRASQRAVTLTAFAVGGLVLAIGVLAAAFIARSIAKRLRRIAEVASAVTAGELDQRPIVDRSTDELGTLARAFNAMLAQLRSLMATAQEMARREQQTLSDANTSLERRVDERTRALSLANDRLEGEIAHRNKVEIELRHAQKLESVGRLAAGVAHEINTPIQFVSDSVHFVRDAVRDILPAVTKLQDLRRATLDGPEPVVAAAATAALEAEEAADLPYFAENALPALERALEGLERVGTIVRAMKEFAHPDQKEMTSLDLNRAIESTLVIARNEYKLVAEVETRFEELPRVVCHAGEVNQVVLNIVVNAAHAVAGVVEGTDRKGLITVETRRDGDDVVISIADSGGGIPEAIRHKVFDPFFTTKEVGKGTGQGLAIARSVVVDKHGGNLTFETRAGVGTTFFIRLPLARRAAREPATPHEPGPPEDFLKVEGPLPYSRP